MEDILLQLKQEIIQQSNNPTFVHHSWYVKYHLEIVERIAMELCETYLKADRNLVRALVWLHDYGKILGSTNEMTIIAGRQKLSEIGFPNDFIEETIRYISLIDGKSDIEHCPIEVQIVSSADGAAHLVGPFYLLWWYENHDKPFMELIEDNIKKTSQDWHKKIVLPEVKNAFGGRYDMLLENLGIFPDRFIAIR